MPTKHQLAIGAAAALVAHDAFIAIKNNRNRKRKIENGEIIYARVLTPDGLLDLGEVDLTKINHHLN